VTARHDRIGPLLVTALGVAALAAGPSAAAQAPSTPSRQEASPPEVLVTATRLADEALTAKVVQVLKDDPYLFADHISVVAENGVVRLQGIATDVHDLRRALFLARRAAGKRRVLNEVEFIAQNTDLD
jgi:osmotically-inducible protein OsmY